MSLQKITNFKKNDILYFNNRYYKVFTSTISKPGKGGAYCTIVAKDIHTKKKIEKRFSTSESLTLISVHTKKLTFEYLNGNIMVMFDDEGNQYEAAYINKIIKEDMILDAICTDSHEILHILPPKEITSRVLSTSGRSSDSTKEQSALLVNGVTIKCPNYVKVGQTVKIRGEDTVFLGVVRE